MEILRSLIFSYLIRCIPESWKKAAYSHYQAACQEVIRHIDSGELHVTCKEEFYLLFVLMTVMTVIGWLMIETSPVFIIQFIGAVIVFIGVALMLLILLVIHVFKKHYNKK